jgi:hypothetical protein
MNAEIPSPSRFMPSSKASNANWIFQGFSNF